MAINCSGCRHRQVSCLCVRFSSMLISRHSMLSAALEARYECQPPSLLSDMLPTFFRVQPGGLVVSLKVRLDVLQLALAPVHSLA